MAERFAVVAQRQTTDLGPDGRFTDVMEVTFRVTSTGVTGSVRVPLSMYSADEVRRQVDEYVSAIEDVHNL